jgi:type II secretory pathway component PulJ
MPSQYYKDPKSKRKRQEEIQLNDRYQAIEAEYQTAGYHHVLTQQEKEELAFDNYKKRFSTTYQYRIQNVQRIKHRNQEYLTYKINEEVTDSNNQLHMCERRAGWRTSPIIKPQRKNEFGEVIESD